MYSFLLCISIIYLSPFHLVRGEDNGEAITTKESGSPKSGPSIPPVLSSIIPKDALPPKNGISTEKSDQFYFESSTITSTRTNLTEIDLRQTEKIRKNSKRALETVPEALPLPMAQESNAWYQRDEDYIGLDNDGEVCVRAYFHLRITVYYTPKDEEKGVQKAILKPTKKTRISGMCDRKAKIARLVLTWPDAIFAVTFGFDDLLDSWFISQFSLGYDTSTPAFKGLAKDEKVEVVSKPGKNFWTTNRHRSFRCLVSHAIMLSDKDNSHSADVEFGQVRAQALTWNDRFLTPQHCVHRVHRDAKVPWIVGGTLAFFTLLTVAAYGGFRYFKVKNVEYETMQL